MYTTTHTNNISQKLKKYFSLNAVRFTFIKTSGRHLHPKTSSERVKRLEKLDFHREKMLLNMVQLNQRYNEERRVFYHCEKGGVFLTIWANEESSLKTLNTIQRLCDVKYFMTALLLNRHSCLRHFLSFSFYLII